VQLKTFVSGILVVIIVGTLGLAKADEDKFLFPDPFSMDSPVSPMRDGGVDFRYLYTNEMSAVAFPLVSRVSTEARSFFAQIFLPMVVAIPNGGEAVFGFGDPRISVLGSWRLDIPFGEDLELPAAVSAGCDVNIPFSSAWGDLVQVAGADANVSLAANAVGMAMYSENPVGWVPGFFGFNPRGMFAIGPEIFFSEFEISFPAMIPIRWRSAYNDELFLAWSVVLGSQPLDFISFMAEFSGITDLVNNAPIRGSFRRTQMFLTFGSRLTFGNFEMGLMFRLPVSDQWAISGASDNFIVGLYVGGSTEN